MTNEIKNIETKDEDISDVITISVRKDGLIDLKATNNDYAFLIHNLEKVKMEVVLHEKSSLQKGMKSE